MILSTIPKGSMYKVEYVEGVKTCKTCGVEKPLECFQKHTTSSGGRLHHCRACQNAKEKQWKIDNPDKAKARKRRDYEKNKESYLIRAKQQRVRIGPEVQRKYNSQYYREKSESIKLRVAKYRAEHPEEYKVYNARARANKRKDVGNRISDSISSQIYYHIKTKKSGHHWEFLVGYTIHDLMQHLESLFTDGMSWENYGEWHIDHITPLSWYKIKSHDDPLLRSAWALDNLQPLWAFENISKGNKVMSYA